MLLIKEKLITRRNFWVVLIKSERGDLKIFSNLKTIKLSKQ